jgi:branched-chain amino acid transport system substrate-binding protein
VDAGRQQGDANHVYGYAVVDADARDAETLRRRTHARERHEAGAGFKNFELPILLPGIKINTSPTDYYPIQAVQLSRFKDDSMGAVSAT